MVLSSSTTRHVGDLRSRPVPVAHGASDTTLCLCKPFFSSRINPFVRGDPSSAHSVINPSATPARGIWHAILHCSTHFGEQHCTATLSAGNMNTSGCICDEAEAARYSRNAKGPWRNHSASGG